MLFSVFVQLYSPKRPLVDVAEVFLWLMAVGTILCASYWSAWTAREAAIEQDKLLKVEFLTFWLFDFLTFDFDWYECEIYRMVLMNTWIWRFQIQVVWWRSTPHQQLCLLWLHHVSWLCFTSGCHTGLLKSWLSCLPLVVLRYLIIIIIIISLLFAFIKMCIFYCTFYKQKENSLYSLFLFVLTSQGLQTCLVALLSWYSSI